MTGHSALMVTMVFMKRSTKASVSELEKQNRITVLQGLSNRVMLEMKKKKKLIHSINSPQWSTVTF